MTTAKSIPGLLRKLANTIERAMGVPAEDASLRRCAQCQCNADAPPQIQHNSANSQTIAKAVAGELDRRECARAASKFRDAQ